MVDRFQFGVEGGLRWARWVVVGERTRERTDNNNDDERERRKEQKVSSNKGENELFLYSHSSTRSSDS